MIMLKEMRLRKRSLLLGLFLAACPLLVAQQALNNDALISLVKAGLSDDVIVAKINSSQPAYDTSPNAISALRSAGASDKVISAIISKAAVSQPAPSNARVFVYRKGGIVGGGADPLVYVNDYLLAELHPSEFASVEVPPGKVVIVGAYTTRIRGVDLPTPTGEWASLPGCAQLNWRRLAAAAPSDIALCRDGLSKLSKECGARPSHNPFAMTIPACNPKLNGLSNDWPGLLGHAGVVRYALNGAPENKRISGSVSAPLWIEVEAGKTYYVRRVTTAVMGKFEVVDTPTGIEEMKQLSPARRWPNSWPN